MEDGLPRPRCWPSWRNTARASGHRTQTSPLLARSTRDHQADDACLFIEASAHALTRRVLEGFKLRAYEFRRGKTWISSVSHPESVPHAVTAFARGEAAVAVVRSLNPPLSIQ